MEMHTVGNNPVGMALMATKCKSNYDPTQIYYINFNGSGHWLNGIQWKLSYTLNGNSLHMKRIFIWSKNGMYSNQEEKLKICIEEYKGHKLWNFWELQNRKREDVTWGRWGARFVAMAPRRVLVQKLQQSTKYSFLPSILI